MRQSRMPCSIGSPGCGGLAAHVLLERREVVAHQQRLVEERREVVRPAELVEARDEGRRVAHEHDDVHAEAVREPLGREERDRVLEQRPEPGAARAPVGAPVAHGARELGRRAHRGELARQVIAQLDRAREALVAVRVLGTDVLEEALELDGAHARPRERAEGFVHEPDLAAEREHRADPGRAGAVRARHEDRGAGRLRGGWHDRRRIPVVAEATLALDG